VSGPLTRRGGSKGEKPKEDKMYGYTVTENGSPWHTLGGDFDRLVAASASAEKAIEAVFFGFVAP